MTDTTMFGIPNCDTIKKAKMWLSENNMPFEFHDYRKDGITLEWLEEAESHLGWENIINKRGTTFRQLSDAQKANLNKQTALELLKEMPAMIKRPILIHQGNYYLGFKADDYAKALTK